MNFKSLLPVYFFTLTAECFGLLTGNAVLQFCSKPLLMLILIYHFSSHSKNLNSLKYLVIAALSFSWLGDIVLLIDRHHSRSFFVFGLLSFLIAHLFYIYYFWRIRKYNSPPKSFNPLTIAGIFTYFAAVYATLLPHLVNMHIPVLIYSLIISLMLLTSLHAFNLKKQLFGQFCVAGTLLFAVSDSILAFNRFYSPFELGSVFVMLTYSIAQLLIMEGSLRNLRAISDRPEDRLFSDESRL